jgi:hypothetical protein
MASRHLSIAERAIEISRFRNSLYPEETRKDMVTMPKV